MVSWIIRLASESAYLLKWRHWALNGNWVKLSDHRRNERVRNWSALLRFLVFQNENKHMCWFSYWYVIGGFISFLRWQFDYARKVLSDKTASGQLDNNLIILGKHVSQEECSVRITCACARNWTRIFSSHNNLWVMDLEKVKCININVLCLVRISVCFELTPTLLSCGPDYSVILFLGFKTHPEFVIWVSGGCLCLATRPVVFCLLILL